MLQVDLVTLYQRVRRVTLVKATSNETVSYAVFENSNNSLLDNESGSMRIAILEQLHYVAAFKEDSE